MAEQSPSTYENHPFPDTQQYRDMVTLAEELLLLIPIPEYSVSRQGGDKIADNAEPDESIMYRKYERELIKYSQKINTHETRRFRQYVGRDIAVPIRGHKDSKVMTPPERLGAIEILLAACGALLTSDQAARLAELLDRPLRGVRIKSDVEPDDLALQVDPQRELGLLCCRSR